jgi:hypothetical protein
VGGAYSGIIQSNLIDFEGLKDNLDPVVAGLDRIRLSIGIYKNYERGRACQIY